MTPGSQSTADAASVTVIGAADAPLFAEIVATLGDQVHFVRNIQEFAGVAPPHLLVVLQQWPDEYTENEALGLINAAPLGRLIVCYGPWCDSDGRTREIWPLGARVSVAAAPYRLRDTQDEIADARPPFPLTASRSEIYFHQHARSLPRECDSLSIAIFPPAGIDGDWPRPLLEAAGHRVTNAIAPSVDLLIWDADPWGDAAKQEFADLRRACPAVPMAALCGFPRPHIIKELLSAGATSVISKMLDNRALLERLESTALQCESSPQAGLEDEPT